MMKPCLRPRVTRSQIIRVNLFTEKMSLNFDLEKMIWVGKDVAEQGVIRCIDNSRWIS